VVTASTNAASVTATCPAGKIAVGGGGRAVSGPRVLTGSYPNATTGAPTAWIAVFDGANNGNTAYVICTN
jgi:hypothetical protein